MGKARNRQREDGRSTNNYNYKNGKEEIPLEMTPEKFLSQRVIELKPRNEKQRAYIDMIHNLNLVIATGYAGCVDKDTEYLTPNGWKKISNYIEGDLVAQANNGGYVDFVKPISYIKQPCDNFNYFINEGIDQKLSDDHRIVDAGFNSTLVSDFVKNKNNTLNIYTSFHTNDSETDDTLSTFMDLLCWLKGVKNDNTYIFNLVDISHITTLDKTLSELNIVSNKTDTQLIITYTPIIDFNSFTILPTNTAFTAYVGILYILNTVISFLDDYTVIELDETKLDQLQIIVSSCGHTGIIKNNKLYISTKSAHIITSDSVQSYKSLDGYKYCFEVESGALLLRSNGNISITGNSSKTYCPTMIAAQMLRNKQIDRIVLIRSPVSDEESVGMLKGDLIEKTKYWLMPILDTLNKALSPSLVDLLIKREQILCLAPEFLKGVSFTDRDFVIFDEAEDMSKSVALATVTRQGGGKMILCGDLRQSMISRESGLPMLLNVIQNTPKLKEKVGVVDFDSFDDIVRSEDCKDWVKAFCKSGLM